VSVENCQAGRSVQDSPQEYAVRDSIEFDDRGDFRRISREYTGSRGSGVNSDERSGQRKFKGSKVRRSFKGSSTLSIYEENLRRKKGGGQGIVLTIPSSSKARSLEPVNLFRRRKRAWFLWISCMKPLYKSRCILNVDCRFPRILRVRISFPLDEIE
jgi:hypothetical protein